MPQIDRHLTTEQLSGLLDEQLSPEEIATSNAHLYTCERCQQELAGLRQTVTLLRALPLPVLPRSFVLPVTTTTPHALAPEKISARVSIVHTPPTRSAASQPLASRTSRTYVRRALRLTSGLVAVVGIIFVFSGLVMSLPHLGMMTSAASTNSASSVDSQVSTPVIRTMVTTSAVRNNTTTAAPTDADGDNDQAPALAPSVHAPLKPSSMTPPVSANPQQSPAFVLFFDLNSQAGRLALGILLCIIGMMGYTLFAQHKKSVVQNR